MEGSLDVLGTVLLTSAVAALVLGASLVESSDGRTAGVLLVIVGFRVVEYGRQGITEVGSFIDEGGHNFRGSRGRGMRRGAGGVSGRRCR